VSLLAYGGAAWSHAHLTSQEPAADTSSHALKQVRLEFSEPLEGALSRIELIDGAGKMAAGNKTISDPTLPKVLVLPLGQSLPPGIYTVKWDVVSEDGHRTRGSYPITVKQ